MSKCSLLSTGPDVILHLLFNLHLCRNENTSSLSHELCKSNNKRAGFRLQHMKLSILHIYFEGMVAYFPAFVFWARGILRDDPSYSVRHWLVLVEEWDDWIMARVTANQRQSGAGIGKTLESFRRHPRKRKLLKDGMGINLDYILSAEGAQTQSIHTRSMEDFTNKIK